MPIDLSQLLQTQVALDGQSLTGLHHARASWTPWLKKLPTLELADSTEKVFIALMELRNYAITEMQRFALLQQLEPYLNHLTEVLERHYLGYNLIDATQDRHFSNLILEIKTYHALIYLDIYQRTGQQLRENKFSLFDINGKKKAKQLHLESAFATLYTLGELLYTLRLIEHPTIPTHFWHIVYDIYRDDLLESDKETSVHLEINSISPLNTIKKAFHFIILFYLLTDQPTKHYNIYALKKCAPYWLSLVQYTTEEDKYSAYILNYQDNEIPQAYNRIHEKNPTTLYINISQLIAYLESTLTEHPKYYHETEEKLLTLPLKQHILTLLMLNPVRHHPRQEINGQINITLGMSSAHYFLSHAKHFKESLALEHNFGLQNNTQALSSGNHSQTKSITKTFQQQFLEEISKYYQAELVDKSSTGYGVHWTHTPVKNLREGELSLVREPDEKQWNATIIRWTKNADADSLDMGLQLLSRNLCALAVYKNNFNQTAPVYHPAIYCTDKFNQPCLILSGGQIFQENQNLILRFGTDEIKIFLKQIQLTTAHCIMCGFDVLELSKLSLFEDYIVQQTHLFTTTDLWDALK